MQVFEDPIELPDPPLLIRLVWLTYHAGPESGRIACARCQIVYVKSEAMNMRTAEPFVHVVGTLPPADKIIAMLIPCKYITYAELGAQFETEKGGVASDRLNFIPTSPAAQGAMEPQKINAIISKALPVEQGNGSR